MENLPPETLVVQKGCTTLIMRVIKATMAERIQSSPYLRAPRARERRAWYPRHVRFVKQCTVRHILAKLGEYKSEINAQRIRDSRFHGAIRTLHLTEMSCIMIRRRKRKQTLGATTTYPFVLLNFCRLSFETTCPQLIIIGGFCSVD